MSDRTAEFYTIKQGKVSCRLCPNYCVIDEGQSGQCNIRVNKNGDLTLPYYGELSAIAPDPIEKKPLYHFYPGSRILSVGFLGCSLHCPFCQNFSISQEMRSGTQFVSPPDLITMAQNQRSFGIAYTYSEPAIHFEYVTDCARLAHEQGLKNVLVTNGYLNAEPAEQMLDLMDAVNVDLKCFNNEFYKEELGGKLQPVLDFITAAAPRTSVEATTLVIPTKNDSDEEMRQIASFIAGIDENIPLHLSRYYPTYKYTIPPTEVQTVERLAGVAKEYLNFVYLGNVGTLETNTYCPKCGNLLIRRSGYSVTKPGVKDGACQSCGFIIPIPGV